MNDVDVYGMVLTDLRFRRSQIDAAIEAIEYIIATSRDLPTAPGPAPLAVKEPEARVVVEPVFVSPPAVEVPAPAPPIAKAEPPARTILPPLVDSVWRCIAKVVSECGMSPSLTDVAVELGANSAQVSNALHMLCGRGYTRREGGGRYLKIHVLQWPEGVTPTETTARRRTISRVPGQNSWTRAAIAYEATPAPAPAPAPQPAPAAPEKPLRRFTEPNAFDPTSVRGLKPTTPALIEGRTIFPHSVKDAAESPRLLISGKDNRKLGDRVTKGPWKGMPIYALTLEERATCPKDCHHLADCYGNSMQWARRHRDDGTLLQHLYVEVADLAREHPDGFVVRLHVLGDFIDVPYVLAWRKMLEEFPPLHVFGYTAWKTEDPSGIGLAVDRVREQHWDRFAIRRSSAKSEPMGATTIARRERGQVPEGLVCPAQSEPGVCCGSCGLCWAPLMKDKTIVFMMHGGVGGRRKAVMPPGPNTCTTTGCMGAKQPGRDHCASCLAKAMPPNSRAGMRDSYTGFSHD